MHDPDAVIDFTVGAFVNWRNLAAEITSMISSLYISDEHSDDDDDDDNPLKTNIVNVVNLKLCYKRSPLMPGAGGGSIYCNHMKGPFYKSMI